MQISLLGCGWLGLPLAKRLIADGFTIKGSTTTEAKMDVLNEAGIQPILISLGAEGIQGDISSFLEASEVLIIDIPPKLRKENSENFTDKIRLLIPHIEKSGIAKVLFVGSTSVYADDNCIVTEETPAQPDTESGKQLLESEELLQNNPNFKTTVVRFGGLTGKDRHPVKHLAGKTGLANPDGPVNLIHRTDCIGIIVEIIKKDIWGEKFNGVHPDHPPREAYYTQKAAAAGLPLPEFDYEKPSVGKTVLGNKVTHVMAYNYKENI